MSEEKVIFVFYTLEPSCGSWRYPKPPRGWRWVSAGTTSPVIGEPIESQYDFEEQFSGPQETEEEMIEYLDGLFKQLKDEKMVQRYKIRQSYLS